MGGGISTTNGLEDMLSATFMVGRAIAAISFPGMYRIYDFHSAKAPPLKNARPFTLFGVDNDSDDEEEVRDPKNYEHMFCVEVGNDKVYLEDPLFENNAGWTPLHTCCMSYITVTAGMKLIDETVKRGGSLDIPTKLGPGTFNKGWSPLHMACAYGVEPLVVHLLSSGADPNCTNSFGYTPLLEACHRGFHEIVKMLIQKGARLDYIPPEELSSQSPFVSAPAQAALAEAARCGYHQIVKTLIEGGANKDLVNVVGWTPLHEACFYNRIETVKTLLLHGADASARTNTGALPYHLASIQAIRDMLGDMGGDNALPADGDYVDMLTIIKELTMMDQGGSTSTKKTVSPQASTVPDAKPSSSPQHSPTKSSTPAPKSKAAKPSSESPLLHSGPMLGDLPALAPKKTPVKPQQLHGAVSIDHGSSRKNKKEASEQYKDVPKEFLCELCQKPMTEPVKSVYGNIFDKPVITRWISQQGHICPITGAPLSEAELEPQEELQTRIKKWILQKSMEPASTSGSGSGISPKSPQKTKESEAIDDLYDF